MPERHEAPEDGLAGWKDDKWRKRMAETLRGDLLSLVNKVCDLIAAGDERSVGEAALLLVEMNNCSVLNHLELAGIYLLLQEERLDISRNN